MTFELYKNAFSRYTPNVIIYLATFSHSLFDETYYLTNDNAEVIYDGKTYIPFPFSFTIPSQGEVQGTTMNLMNIERILSVEIGKTIQSNENIILDVKLAELEGNSQEVLALGDYEVLSADITKDIISLGLNQRTSLPYNLGTIRYNQTKFKNLYL